MSRTITLNHITKIEGHAKLCLGIRQGKVTRCELSAVEGARYFEGIVVGRKYYEAHEMTSRICGICSCAHVIAAVTAIERALGHRPTAQTVRLRELLTLGERIRSHATHLYFLALPDYLGYESAIAMATKFKNRLYAALRLMKVGNSVIKLLGARDLHPVSATPGGWLHLPSQNDLDALKKELKAAVPDAEATCRLFFSLRQPRFTSKSQSFSLVSKNEYAMLTGAFSSDTGSFPQGKYLDFISEYHQPRSTSNFVVKDDHRYMVGALSRLNNNHKQLMPRAKRILKASGMKLPSLNPFHNNWAQAIELVHAIEHAVKLCGTLKIRQESLAKLKPRAGRGVAAIEVPRGTLWHDYTLDSDGTITRANIITPTAQNLLNMQEDIRAFVPGIARQKKGSIVLEVEKLIRSYDPCFSCSAHFLEVSWA